MATISNYVDVAANSDAALMTAIAQQPVSIAIEADQAIFQVCERARAYTVIARCARPAVAYEDTTCMPHLPTRRTT